MSVPHRIIAIVEGHGEQTAVPRLLSRWFRHRNFRNFVTPDLAVRAAGCGALKRPHDAEHELGVEHYVEIALRGRPAGILIVVGADDECATRSRTPAGTGLGPEMLARAKAVAPHVPIGVVIANREYEVWFLAALDGLKRRGLVPARATLARGTRVEGKGKALFERLLGRKYEETIDQPDFSDCLPFTGAMARRSRSFRKLLKELESLTRKARRCAARRAR
ncbi:MAG: DUF4276 family protein [Deltaproteobacteria bacterium]|nr:DUF4276 family protein [Deltaproteobacteria bacterium]